MADDWEPHDFWPDLQAMGDCLYCGNRREDCERFQTEWRNAARSDGSATAPVAREDGDASK